MPMAQILRGLYLYQLLAGWPVMVGFFVFTFYILSIFSSIFSIIFSLRFWINTVTDRLWDDLQEV